jgi:iron complex outermembrane receptor protein
VQLNLSFSNSVLLLSAFFLIGTYSDSFAQQGEDSLQVELDPINVTAIRSTIGVADAPLSLRVSSKDLETINHSSSLSLKSVGDDLPGLWVGDRQNYALGERMTIRGIGWRAQFGVRGMQVILNDMPLTIADGQAMTNIIDPAFIRRAELIRGPAATYWGNSSGGVLYLSSIPNYGPGTHGRFRTMAGSFGTYKQEGEVSFSSENHELAAYSSYLTSDGFRDYSAVDIYRSGITGSVKLTSKSELKYQAAGIFMPKAQHPSSLSKQDARDNPTMASSFFENAKAGKEITQGQAGLGYILDTSVGTLNVTGYGIYRDLHNPLPFGIITVDRKVGGLRATLDQTIDQFNLQWGGEIKFQNDDRVEYDHAGGGERGDITVDQIEKVSNQALFMNWTYSLGGINVLGGIRYDRMNFSTDAPSPDQSGERTFDSVSPSIGLSYQPQSYTLYTNLSTSFQAPTTTELVNRPDGGNGFNPELEPESTVGLEAGIRSNGSNQFEYDFAAYHLWIYDLLFPYQLEDAGATFYRNQGETAHLGVEGYIGYQVGRNWEITATANIMSAEFKQAQTLDNESLEGNTIPGIPKHRFNSTVRWSPDNFLGALSYEYASSHPVNNLNTEENDAYKVLDLKLSYQLTFRESGIMLQPFINVNNLLDERYNGSVAINNPGNRYYEPAPGRNWQAGLSVNF